MARAWRALIATAAAAACLSTMHAEQDPPIREADLEAVAEIFESMKPPRFIAEVALEGVVSIAELRENLDKACALAADALELKQTWHLDSDEKTHSLLRKKASLAIADAKSARLLIDHTSKREAIEFAAGIAKALVDLKIVSSASPPLVIIEETRDKLSPNAERLISLTENYQEFATPEGAPSPSSESQAKASPPRRSILTALVSAVIVFIGIFLFILLIGKLLSNRKVTHDY